MQGIKTIVQLPDELNSAICDAVKNTLVAAKKTFDEKEQYPHYLNKKQACSYLNVSYRTLMSWVKNDPNFPYRDVNGVVRFNRDELDKFMASK